MGRKKITITLPSDVIEKIDEMNKIKRLNKSYIIQTALEKFLKINRQEEKK